MTATTHSPRTSSSRRLVLTVLGELALVGALALVGVLVLADVSTLQRELLAVGALVCAAVGVVDLSAARALR